MALGESQNDRPASLLVLLAGVVLIVVPDAFLLRLVKTGRINVIVDRDVSAVEFLRSSHIASIFSASLALSLFVCGVIAQWKRFGNNPIQLALFAAIAAVVLGVFAHRCFIIAFRFYYPLWQRKTHNTSPTSGQKDKDVTSGSGSEV